MPQNCSSDVSKVVDYMDGVLQSNDTSAISSLKAKFGLEGLEHNDDFMAVLEYGPWEWQSNQFYSGYSSFYQFCDTVENVGPLYNTSSASIPGAEGVGLEKALNGYATWIKEEIVPGCKCFFFHKRQVVSNPADQYIPLVCASYGYSDWTDEYELGCFDTYNASSPFYVDTTVDNPVDRQWEWFLCNEPYVHYP